MIRWLTLLFVISMSGDTRATILVPKPERMLTRADTVVVGFLTEEADGWWITIRRVLKGARQTGDRVRLTTSYQPSMFRIEEFYRVVGKDDFLFLAREEVSDNSLQPCFGLSSAWPQGPHERSLPMRTLAGCLAFAEQNLAAQSSQNSLKEGPQMDTQLQKRPVAGDAPLPTVSTMPERAPTMQPLSLKRSQIVAATDHHSLLLAVFSLVLFLGGVLILRKRLSKT